MVEQPDTTERHGNAVLVAGGNNLIIADGAARLHNGGHTAAAGALNVVPKGEECITAQGNIRYLAQPGFLFLGSQRGRLHSKGFGPNVIPNHILRGIADVNINRVIAVGLGICRTSLAVSALRIMRYCPNLGT